MGALRLIIVLVAAAAAAVALALVARHLTATHPSTAMAATAPRPQVRVLVAKRDLKIGDRLQPEDVSWQAWPQEAVSHAFISGGPVKATLVDKAEAALAGDPAIQNVAGSLVLEPIASKEPLTMRKLVKGGEGGFMAVKLPAGMRAMATPVTVESGAGGFILPGDHVDVIEDIKLTSGGTGGGLPAQPVQSRTILTNITVLAIDQSPEAKQGAASQVGATATLEIPEANIDILAKAREEGTLQLALRSHADMDGPQGAANPPPASRPLRVSALPSRAEDISVRIYRGGKVSEVKVP
jgi:pilus assembly protein CpaB